ncbi:MAG TPA: hypothetical protein DDW52_13460 [Planctomycetaceae bacterium]|nr:hypothetical protein [Planctomycetaceae bacterium]
MAGENKVAHLKMIQDVISRLASNSALMKGWAITLVSASFILAARKVDGALVLISLLPALAFWLLDSYYLMLEQRFRNLYSKVSNIDEDSIDFSMEVSGESDDFFQKCMFSRVNWLFYGALLLAIVFELLMCCFAGN